MADVVDQAGVVDISSALEALVTSWRGPGSRARGEPSDSGSPR
jgi:hypothetical protein